MKSLVRWSATLGLVGSTLLGSFYMENLQALALPEAQVMQRLQPVPVFTIADAKGSPLVASVPNGNNNKATPVTGVFISQKDAQAFVDRLKKEKPDLAKEVQVVPVSLAEVYKLKKENENKPDGLSFAFIPVQQQVQSAQALMGNNAQQGQKFQGTPLFVATGGKDNGYLTVEQNGKPVIPFFFEKEQLQGMIDRFKQQKPDLASTVQVKAVPLEGVIQTLQTSNNEQLNNIVLVPPQESINFVRSLAPAQGQSQPAAPAPQTAPPNQTPKK